MKQKLGCLKNCLDQKYFLIKMCRWNWALASSVGEKKLKFKKSWLVD
jgi:hypothetical protein